MRGYFSMSKGGLYLGAVDAEAATTEALAKAVAVPLARVGKRPGANPKLRRLPQNSPRQLTTRGFSVKARSRAARSYAARGHRAGAPGERPAARQTRWSPYTTFAWATSVLPWYVSRSSV